MINLLIFLNIVNLIDIGTTILNYSLTTAVKEGNILFLMFFNGNIISFLIWKFLFILVVSIYIRTDLRENIKSVWVMIIIMLTAIFINMLNLMAYACV